jgi:hypothetical protein
MVDLRRGCPVRRLAVCLLCTYIGDICHQQALAMLVLQGHCRPFTLERHQRCHFRDFKVSIRSAEVFQPSGSSRSGSLSASTIV